MGGPPTYLELSEGLEREIGSLSPGSRVPSEAELAATHGVNRLTARAALQELERRFLVVREQGRGTFVAERIEYRIAAERSSSFSDAMYDVGARPSTRIDSMRVREPSARIRKELELPAGTKVVQVGRRRYVNGSVAGWSESQVAADLVPDLRARLHDDESMQGLLADFYELSPVRAWTRAELEVAPTEIGERMGLPGRPLALYIQGRTDSTSRGRPIELTTSWLRADRFRLVFEMKGA
jgi:GntR family transcriptional regulator